MNRYMHGSISPMPESRMMPHHRDESDTGPSDVSLIPDPERLEELLARVKAADQAIAETQGNMAVPTDLLHRAAEAGHPDAIVFLSAIRVIEARQTAVYPAQAA